MIKIGAFQILSFLLILTVQSTYTNEFEILEFMCGDNCEQMKSIDPNKNSN